MLIKNIVATDLWYVYRALRKTDGETCIQIIIFGKQYLVIFDKLKTFYPNKIK